MRSLRSLSAVTWEGGIESYSGLLDVAIEGGYVAKPTIGWYSKVDKTTGEIEDKKVRVKLKHLRNHSGNLSLLIQTLKSILNVSMK